ncbi:MAG: GNAT family protein [Candidatus Korobacteraceae bacterium]
MLLDLEDLQVRSWRRSDLDALVRHANNAKIAANLRDQFPHPYTRRDGIEYLNFVRDQRPERAFAIQHNDEAIGGLGFQIGVDISRVSAEVGYWISETYWGRGFATRAVEAVTEWAFTEYKLTRVFALVFAYNVPSIRVLEKAGFQQEGILRRSAVKNGVILDQMIYAKVR